MNLIHKEMTDEEIYQNLKSSHNPILMDSEKWKKLRMKILSKEGKVWSI